MIKKTDILEAMNIIKSSAIAPSDPRANRIEKLQIKGAPGLSVACCPIPPKVGTVMTKVKRWDPTGNREQPYPKCINPNEIYVWIAHSESELEKPVHMREVIGGTSCVVIICHTNPMIVDENQDLGEIEQLFGKRYEGSKSEDLLCKSMDFADTIYYAVQFMCGKPLLPFVDVEDPELLQEETPRVIIRLNCESMVMRDMTEASYIIFII